MSALNFLRDETRARLTAQFVANVEAAEQRREIAKAKRAADAAAEWTNLVTMSAQGGRPLPLAEVRRMGRAAKVPAAEIARVAAAMGCLS